MVRLKNARTSRPTVTSFHGFQEGQTVIIHDNDGKNRHGYEGTIVAIGVRKITVKYKELDGYWEGVWRPTMEAYHNGDFEWMLGNTPENRNVLGDHSAHSP
jgi:hypothetical protein